ncbi:MAG: hypothetical protein LBF65_02685 [Holosporales bacterium]|jgi:hypothetical protein|nr:hypothetical protein [Holosporales bacterium]
MNTHLYRQQSSGDFRNLSKIGGMLLATFMYINAGHAFSLASIKNTVSSALSPVTQSAAQVAKQAVKQAANQVAVQAEQSVKQSTGLDVTGVLSSTIAPALAASPAPEQALTPNPAMDAIIGDGPGYAMVSCANRVLSDSDMQYIAQKLTGVTNGLGSNGQTVSLPSCGITATGLKCFFDQLKNSPETLEILDLSGNPIGDDGAAVIAEYMRFLPRLAVIILKGTNITENGLVTIVRAAANVSHGVIQLIDCSDITNITEAGLRMIAKEMKRCPAGAFGDGIDLSGCKIPSTMIASLTEGENILVTPFASSPILGSSIPQASYSQAFNPGQMFQGQSPYQGYV